MESRLRIKIGPMEIEYEGPTDFLKSDLLNMARELIPMCETAQNVWIDDAEDEVAQPDPMPSEISPTLNYSVNTIAGKLNAQSGRDLALAAAAFLTFVNGKESFTRQELLKSMQQATAYYKQTMGSNLSKTITRMIKGDDLLESAKGMYSLAALRKGQLNHELGI